LKAYPNTQVYPHKGLRQLLEVDLFIVTIPKRQDTLRREGGEALSDILPDGRKLTLYTIFMDFQKPVQMTDYQDDLSRILKDYVHNNEFSVLFGFTLSKTHQWHAIQVEKY